jgi:hypothetical protein
MSPLPELSPSRTREVNLFGIYWHNLQTGANDEQIEFATARFALSCFHDNPCFQQSRRRHQARVGPEYGLKKNLPLGFSEKDSSKSRSVDDHDELCRQPVLVVAKDHVGRARIKNWQLIDAPKDFLQLARENLSSPLVAESFQPFLEGFLDGARQGFAGLISDLSGQLFGVHTLDTKGHNIISIP